MTQTHDVVVIGLGVGGEAVAGTLAEAGLDVLDIERNLRFRVVSLKVD